MRSKNRKLVSAVLVTAATTAAALTFAPTAMATQSNCTISPDDESSICTSGTGLQRIDLVIYQANAGQNAVEGNWAAVGQYSTVHTSWQIVRAWIEFSN